MSLLFALMLAGLSLWVGDKNVPVSIFLAASAVWGYSGYSRGASHDQ